MSNIQTYVARRLSAARQKSGMTQSDLAEKTSLSPAYISLLERGERMPHLDVLYDLAKALGVPVAFFFKSEDDKPFERHLYEPLTTMAEKLGLTKAQVDKLIAIGECLYKEEA